MATIFKRKNAAGKKTEKYYIKYKDERGKWKVVVGAATKEASERLAKKLESDAILLKEGIAVPSNLKSELPFEAFATYLKAQKNTDDHVELTLSRIRNVCSACGFATLNDLRQADAQDKVSHYLMNKKKESKRRPLKAKVKVPRRKIKREPEKVEPISARTQNGYITALKSFCKWCVTTGKMPDCTLLQLKRVKSSPEPPRRAATDDEVKRLLRATKGGGDIYGHTPLDRWYLYRTALATGFRASELASLTPATFRLKGALPHIFLKASPTKNRTAAEQPVRPEFAAELSKWLRGRAADEPVWPGNWHEKAAEMLRTDLQAAGVPYEVEGRVLDFHALRVTFITSLARAGVHPKTAQILARHKTINLTMNYYTHLNLKEVSAALPPAVSV